MKTICKNQKKTKQIKKLDAPALQNVCIEPVQWLRLSGGTFPTRLQSLCFNLKYLLIKSSTILTKCHRHRHIGQIERQSWPFFFFNMFSFVSCQLKFITDFIPSLSKRSLGTLSTKIPVLAWVVRQHTAHF